MTRFTITSSPTTADLVFSGAPCRGGREWQCGQAGTQSITAEVTQIRFSRYASIYKILITQIMFVYMAGL